MTKAFVKKGDTVKVISGNRKDHGRTGKVLRVFPKDQRILVENINLRKKHVRPNPQKNVKGGIIDREQPIHQSNVKVISED
jgi:large subunit ribosomal protein L24